MTADTTLDLVSAQRRIVRVLAVAQVLGGIGVASGIAVGALLAADLGGESLSGFASASGVLGAAFIAVPVTRLMDARGRRPGLVLAYAIGTAGAFITILGAALGLFPLALMGLVLTGGGTAAGLQSRYAATDLADTHRRGRSLATVVWATTIGSVLGPNLAQPMGDVAGTLGLPRLAGPYMVTLTAFVVAALLIAFFLRPDPLLTAKQEAARRAGLGGAPARPRRSFGATLRKITSIPAAALGLTAVAAGHAVMVGVMSMTPLHLGHGGASLQIIGLVISGHITGMYIASPVVGVLSDRLGRRQVISLGAGLLLLAVAIAGTAAGHESVRLAIGLFILGLGWSCTLISGSTLLTESVPLEDRAGVQGASDLLMGIAGASAGVLSGVVVGLSSFAVLALLAALLIAPLPVLALRDSRRLAAVEVGPTPAG